MTKKYINWKTKGMNRDMSASAFYPEFAFENVNIRLATNDGNTMMSWVNERGTKKIRLHINATPNSSEPIWTFTMVGVPVGTAVLNHKLVVFTHFEKYHNDNIYVFEVSKDDDYDFEGKWLYNGGLGFSTDYPIETLVSYESENIQKVYWTDNLNQPRVINIAPSMDAHISKYTEHSFDFIPELKLEEKVTVSKIYGMGEFPAGVLQYAFTYYNKYGQESNIFYTTPLQYISYIDRGGSPEDKVANSFKIEISNFDTNFDYLRIYSILRTSINATPFVKRVQDIPISDFPELRSGGETEARYSISVYYNRHESNGLNIDTNYSGNYYYADYHILTDDDCPKPSYKENVEYWESFIPQSDEDKKQIKVYKFSRRAFPKLQINLTDSREDNYFTWAKESLQDAVIYVMRWEEKEQAILVCESEGGSKESVIYCSHDGKAVISSGETMTFTDNGLQGDSIDPTELLYKGGEEIVAKTMEQKDGTLFLADIELKRKSISFSVKNTLSSIFSPYTKEIDKPTTRDDASLSAILSGFAGNVISNGDMAYVNSINISGFKSREVYRIGMMFQHKTGKWSEPLWLRDYKIDKTPSIDESSGTLYIPQVNVSISNTVVLKALMDEGYKKARLLMVQPSVNDRTIVCQGIANSCLYQSGKRYIVDTNGYPDQLNYGFLYGQSSWIFRPKCEFMVGDTTATDGGGFIPSESAVYDTSSLSGVSSSLGKFASPNIRSTEVGASLRYDSFEIDPYLFTLHSPELIFDETLYSKDWQGAILEVIGEARFSLTFGDIDIQTSSPTISSAPGFIHKNVKTNGNAALVSGLYYEDYIVDDLDSTPKYGRYESMHVPVSFPVFLWHHNGSLNNDVARTGRSAELLKKKISNYHMSNSVIYSTPTLLDVVDMKVFNSDVLAIEKLEGHPYMANIDTMLIPYKPEYKYFVGDPWRTEKDTNMLSNSYYRLGLKTPGDSSTRNGIWHLSFGSGLMDIFWGNDGKQDKDIGDIVSDLCETSEPISIKYKSTPHLVALVDNSKDATNIFRGTSTAALPILEVKKNYDKGTMYGGQTADALKANVWIPISEPVSLNDKGITLTSNRGDTYYQRFECLKTYAFTPEDKNQVVDIASFVCETHINIDGRYDRNRAQVSNLNMTPQNFNLLNPVYSQMDNFFSYRMLDEDDYKNVSYPNTVTWTKTKQSGADVDLWTNITLANTLELDGDKGTVNKLIRLNNQLLSFQDSGISQILYNENTQISTTEGVPIEIANSEKVQGKRYLSDTVGCSNKWSIAQTPAGIYFMDSNEKSIYLFNGQLNNLSTAGGFNSWAKQNIPPASVEWSPYGFARSNAFVTYYDKLNQEVLFITGSKALAYSEKFGCFTSFYDYGGVPYFDSLDDMGIWTTANGLWKHQAGNYCSFFGENKPFSMTLVANQEPQVDKVFTNLEFRACVDGEGTYDEDKDKFTPSLPFDTLETWDEYQHGILSLGNRNKGDRFTHGTEDSILSRKFRMWRCDIPRDNAPIDAISESKMGIKRFKARPLDRIRNPWAYIRLTKDAASNDSKLNKTEIHDIIATYFG